MGTPMKKRTPRGEKQHPSEPIVSAKSSKADRVDGVCVGEEPLPGMKLRAICRGHTGSIGRISWSPCGDFIASPSDDKTIRIWDAKNGACLALLEGHETGVSAVSWSLDGQIISSGD